MFSMANEAVIIELGPDGGRPIRRTVADGTSISKGTLLILSSDPNTATASAAGSTGSVWAGIAAADKVASDGSTNLAAYTTGVFDLTNSTVALTLGSMVAISGANTLRAATSADFISNLHAIKLDSPLSFEVRGDASYNFYLGCLKF